MAVIYEWGVEELSDDSDDPEIIETHFVDSYLEAQICCTRFDIKWFRIVLIRDVGNNIEGLTDRAWAYVVDGKLPEYFEYSAGEKSDIKVPKRFHKET